MDTDMAAVSVPVEARESAPVLSDADAALQELFTLVEALEAEPGNIPLLERHLAAARRVEGMEEQAQRGLELLLEVKAVGEALWTEALQHLYRGIPLMTEERAPAVFSLLAKASSDYCCIPVLSLVARILAAISGHPEAQQPDAMDTSSEAAAPPVATDLRVEEYQAREIWKQAVQMAEYDISQSHVLWEQYKAWEMRILQALPDGTQERVVQLKRMHQVWIDRLATPHANSSETSTAYSTFNSTFAPEAYEAHMVTATKAASKPAAKYTAREAYETGLGALPAVPVPATLTSPELQQRLAYLYAYLEMELAGGEKKADWKMVQCVYERMVALLGAADVAGGKPVEARIWEKYGNYMAQANGPSKVQKGEIWTRAVRACPGSGDLWAKVLRVQETADQPPDVVGGTYVRALSLGELTRPSTTGGKKGKGKEKEQAGAGAAGTSAVAELVKLEVAWAGYLRRQEEANDEGMEDDDEVESALESALRAGIAQCKAIDPAGDSDFKLEKYLISWLRRKGRLDEAAALWEDIVKVNAKSHRLWLSYTDFEIHRLNYPKARTLFKNAVNKALDWPEAVWEAWTQFEEYYGTADSLEVAKTRIAYLEDARQKKQMKEYQQQQALMASRPAEDSAATAVTLERASESNARIDELAPADEDTKKRKSNDHGAETTEVSSASKKARIDEPVAPPAEPKETASLKRDREHSTVFVSGLASNTTENAVRQRFNDCGAIREIVLTKKGESILATVEFMERESVPAALTKDKKKIGDSQIDVYVAWQSTLFITNFPEAADDQSMRELFLPYGEILDTRWPAKKFKNSRRFLYLQYQSPDAAVAALELHGRALQPGMPLSVLISDPERKKERSDANADDREVYVTQLSRFAAEKDLQKLFRPCGQIKRINVAQDDQGHCKGFAFVEFEDEASVEAALALNGTELKKRRMSVQKSQKQRGGPRRAEGQLGTAGVRGADTSDGLSRSIRLKNLPPKTSEGLLQQALEKITNVKVLQVFELFHEATAELQNASDVGALLLRAEPFVYNGATIDISAETDPDRSNLGSRIVRPAMAPRPVANPGAPPRPATSFVPRPPKSAAKKRLALTTPSTNRKLGTGSSAPAAASNGSSEQTSAKGQDDFRKMLLEGKKSE